MVSLYLPFTSCGGSVKPSRHRIWTRRGRYRCRPAAPRGHPHFQITTRPIKEVRCGFFSVPRCIFDGWTVQTKTQVWGQTCSCYSMGKIRPEGSRSSRQEPKCDFSKFHKQNRSRKSSFSSSTFFSLKKVGAVDCLWINHIHQISRSNPGKY